LLVLVELIPTNGRKISKVVGSIRPVTKKACIELILVGCRGNDDNEDEDDDVKEVEDEDDEK